MKHRQHPISWLVILLISSCAGGLSIPAVDVPTETPLPPTFTLVPVSTATPPPTTTPSPADTVTPSPTIFVTPTDTPENFVLAESGYDIADVRLSYTREDIMVIDFKYRLDENLESQKASIVIELPRRCQDAQYWLSYQAEEPIGEGQMTFKTTLEGECTAETFDMLIWPDYDDYSVAREPVYRETIKQPYYLVRNFPTLNKDVLSVRNFEYRSTGEWSGVLSFEYSISEAIPIPLEEYYFSVAGRGNDNCDFHSQGPILAEHSGMYEIPIDLTTDIYFGFQDATCLDHVASHSYGTVYFYTVDHLAGATVDFLRLGIPIKIWRMP